MRLASTWSMLMPPWMIGPLLDRHAGEQVAGLRRMDAHAGGRLVEQAVDDVDLRLERLQRRQDLAELHLGARPFRPPAAGIDAVAHEQHGEALGQPAVVAAEAEPMPKPDSDSSHGKAMVTPAPRRKVRRDNACSRSRRASCCVFIIDHLSLAVSCSRPRLFRNCRLVTMLSITVPKR